MAFRKVFVGGLNWDTTEDKLRAYFSQFGTIAQCVIMTDSATKRSRGFGFVTFSDPAVVDSILSRTHVLDGKTIDPKRAIPKSSIVVAPDVPQPIQPQQQQFMMQSNLSNESVASNVSVDKIFVGGLPADATDAHMRAVFERYGKLVECCAMVDKDTGRMRGFGFVRFSDATCVERVLEAQKHGGIVICGKLVEVKKATPKTKMVAPPPISTIPTPAPSLSSNPLGLTSLSLNQINTSTLSMSNMFLNPLSPTTTALPQHRFTQQPQQPRFHATTLSPLTLSPTSPQAGGPLLLPKRFLNATQPYKLQPPASRGRAHSITTLQQQQQQQVAPTTGMGFRRGSAPYASGWEVAMMEEEMRIRSRQLQIQQLREQQQMQAQMQQLQMQQFQMWQMQQQHQQQNGGGAGGMGGFMM
ncbi:hypothetical protein BJ742DRAFT_308585 [Cladochytrium replicatum]|nr:hypothetical protein BJ742DRAFT_308585 [Cladochytrium replicatum]